MKILKKILSENSSINKIRDLINEQKKVFVSSMYGSSREFLAVSMTNFTERLLIVVSDESQTDAIGQNIKAFSNILNRNATVVPYLYARSDTDRTDKAVLNEKLRAIKLFKENKNAMVVASIKGLRENHFIDISESLNLTLKSTTDRDLLIRTLFENGYERVSYVEQPGEFAVRGGIIDYYGFANEWPIRMELVYNSIELIKEFDPVTQRTIKDIQNALIIKTHKTVEPLSIRDIITETDRVIFFGIDAYNEFPCPDSKNIILSEVINDSLVDIKQNDLLIKSDFSSYEFYMHNLSSRVDDLTDWIFENKKLCKHLYITCATEGEIHRLSDLLTSREIDEKSYTIVQSELLTGFILFKEKFALLTDSEIFKRYNTRNIGFKFGKGFLSKPAREFEIGDLVVHFSHGIGVYHGIKETIEDGVVAEAMVIEYAEGSKLHVPCEQFFLVEKYIGTTATKPKLDKLASTKWAKKKEDAQMAICDYASKIIRLEAERELKTKDPLNTASHEISDFEHSFRFQETFDQSKAINDIKVDLSSDKPMNRLILGDAGFGKTEVAIRAAFMTAMAGCQTAMLVPTTILAEQHYKSFRERMADYPVRIEVLSRFSNPKEQKNILTDLKNGLVDIIIGTHRLVQKDVIFKHLGLLVIDEEQRFGVVHKDFLLRKNPLINILNLSATPIPRTLYLSLMGVRNMSAIMTPPQERRPIETTVIKEDWFLVKKAIETEIARNGQVFFVHNRINTINKIYNILKSMMPNVRFSVAHGRLPEMELKTIMSQFESGQIDCLIATNIIESGLDMPNANTLFVHNADKFGLAELYQLRGRIGRFNRKAYAYFILTPGRHLDTNTKKRINAILEFSKPGGGYHVALKDLEIRGAGNILGTAQSGHIAAIGFDLYCKLLRDAVKVIKGIPITPKYEVHLSIESPGFLSGDYIPDFQDRFNYYKKLASSESVSEIDEIENELKDKFGRLKAGAFDLLQSFRIKCLSRNKGILKIEQFKTTIQITDKYRTPQLFDIKHSKEGISSYVLRIINENY